MKHSWYEFPIDGNMVYMCDVVPFIRHSRLLLAPTGFPFSGEIGPPGSKKGQTNDLPLGLPILHNILP